MEMKHHSLLERVEIIKQAVIRGSHNESYIPLNGKYTTNPEEEPFDLVEKIQSFFVFDNTSNYDPKVMLLMGDTGSGKSMFSQQLYQRLWKAYKAGDPIPLWIPLPELQNPFEGAVEEILTKCEFNESQIAEMKAKERFIFVVDGYDELHQFQNCYVTNKWHQWDAKVLITCRSQALYCQKDPDKYFMPFKGEKRLPQLLRRLYVAPFSNDQISAYVKKYQQLNAENRISEEDFAKVPGLAELINTPFLLHLAVEGLPDILASQVNNEKITQAKVYDVFIERWFARQVEKLSAAGLLKETKKNTKQEFWDYCKRLAQQMHEKQVSLIPYLGQKVGGRLFGKQEKENVWASFFNEESEILRSACPLKRFGEHHYGFVHASMIEYFAANAMYEEITENVSSETEIISPDANGQEITRSFERGIHGDEDERPRSSIHQRLFALERQMIQFLADRIELNAEFKQKMRAIVEASKSSEKFAIGAANAITALIRAGVAFNGINLSGIKIPGADISGGFFDGADLTKTDLSDTQMFHACLRGAKLDCSLLKGVNFGEFPWFRHKAGMSVTTGMHPGHFDYREDLKLLITGCREGVVLWDLVSGKELRQLHGYVRSGKMNNVAISPDGSLVALSIDNKVLVKEIASKKERIMFQHENEVCDARFSPDGLRLVSISGEVRVFDLVKSKEIASLSTKKSGYTNRMRSPHINKFARCIQFNPNGEMVVFGIANFLTDNYVRIWDIVKDKVTLLDHQSDVCSVQFNLDGRRVMSGGGDFIRIWDVATAKELTVIKLGSVSCMAFSLNEEFVAYGCENEIRVLDVSTRKEIALLRGHTSEVIDLQFISDGKRIVSNSHLGDNSVRIWDVISGNTPGRLSGHRGSVLNIVSGSSGKRIISWGSDGILKIWDRENGKNIKIDKVFYESTRTRIHDYECMALSSNDEMVIFRFNEKKSFEIYNVLNRKKLCSIHASEGIIESVSFSPNNKLIGYSCGDNTVRICDVNNGKEVIVLSGHKLKVSCFVFSPDGKCIVSGSSDKTVRIWDIAHRKELILLQLKSFFTSISFSPDGSQIIIAGDGVHVYNIQSGLEMPLLEEWNNQMGVDARETDFNDDRAGVGSYNKTYCTSARISLDGLRVITGYHMEGGKHVSTRNVVHILDIASNLCISKMSFMSGIQFLLQDGSFVFGNNLGSVECYDFFGDRWQLRWSTDIDSPVLNVQGLVANDLVGLSEEHHGLLQQRGAIIKSSSIVDSPDNKSPIISRVREKKPSFFRGRKDQNKDNYEKKEPDNSSSEFLGGGY